MVETLELHRMLLEIMKQTVDFGNFALGLSSDKYARFRWKREVMKIIGHERDKRFALAGFKRCDCKGCDSKWVKWTDCDKCHGLGWII